MKRNFLKKCLAVFLMGFALVGLASCQTTEKNSKISVDASTVQVYKLASDPLHKYYKATIGIVNPTIYDVTEMNLTYEVYDQTGTLIANDTVTSENLLVRHGAAGYIFMEDKQIPTEYNNAATIKITGGVATKYRSVWDTYLVWFIIAIVLVSLGLLFFAIDIFRKELTMNDIKALLSQRIASSLVTGLLVAIICLVPLMFASWVVTVILLGGYLSFIVLAFILAWIRSLAVKKTA